MADRIFWFTVTGLLVGVAIESLLGFGLTLVGLLVTLAIGVVLLTSASRRLAPAVPIIIFLVAVSLGVARMHGVSDIRSAFLDTYIGEKIILEGKVSHEPDERERTVRVFMRAESLDEQSVDAGVLLVLPAHADISYGDVIVVSGTPEFPKSFEGDTGRVFNYPKYLAKDGVAYEIAFPQVEILERDKGNPIKAWLFNFKQRYLDGLALSLPEPHSALAGGITVGDKRALGGDLLDLFRITGIIHIVVLSGYNITIIAESIRKVFARAIFLPRAASWILSGLTILLFVIMTGASATGVRAGAMAGLAIFARAVNRPYAITRALVLTAAGMVLWSPYILLYDPGFQLSVLATLGLIHIAPIIENKLPAWIPNKLSFREISGATIGTQIAVLPLLLYQMGLFSLVALPVNLLILPAIPAAMFFSMVAGAFGNIAVTLAPLFAAPAYALLSYSLWVVELFGKIPIAATTIGAFSVIWVLLGYAIIVVLFRSAHQPPSN